MHRLSCLNNQIVQQFTVPVFVRNASSKGLMGLQSKIMSKLLTGKKKSKKYWKMDDDVPKLPSIASLSNPTSQTKPSLRRVHILNKMFMRSISDYMSTDGTFSGYGLEISRVNVTIDFQLVNVYWLARGDGSDEKLEAILSKSAGMIRHNLSQLRLMGEVPTIKFVRDKTYAKMVEVETLLKVADFGDDFVPSSPSQMVRNDLAGSTIQDDNELPEMTHNIFGLNHKEIMHRVTQNMVKLKQAWEKYEAKLPDSLEKKYAFTTGEERKEAIIRLKEEEFQAFLNQRRSRKYREKRPRPSAEEDDSDEDDANYFDEEDTYIDDFAPSKK